MPANGHYMALLKMILNSKVDRILRMTSPSMGHILELEQQERLHCSVTSPQRGALNDGTPQFNLRAKIQDGIKQTNKQKPVRHDFIHLLSSCLPPSILSSLSSSHHLVSCAPSVPQHHVGPDLLNLPPPSLAPNTSHFTISSTYICYVAKR